MSPSPNTGSHSSIPTPKPASKPRRFWHRQLSASEPHLSWRNDLRSKLVDGLGTAAALYVLLTTLALLIDPIEKMFGRPALLIYTLVMLAAAIFSLEHALLTRFAENTRSRYGLLGGLLTWAVIDLSNGLGAVGMSGMGEVILYLLVALVIATLWRKLLPVGGRFFALAFLIAWGTRLFLGGSLNFLPDSAATVMVLRGAGYLAAVGALASALWIIFRSERQIQRIWAAAGLWFLLLTVWYLLG